jgi:hypothetical protein
MRRNPSVRLRRRLAWCACAVVVVLELTLGAFDLIALLLFTYALMYILSWTVFARLAGRVTTRYVFDDDGFTRSRGSRTRRVFVGRNN